MSAPIHLTRLKVLPLAQRHSMARLEDIMADPDGPPPPCAEPNMALIRQCARAIAQARARKAAVMLMVLGPEVSGKVVRHLDEEHTELLTLELARTVLQRADVGAARGEVEPGGDRQPDSDHP